LLLLLLSLSSYTNAQLLARPTERCWNELRAGNRVDELSDVGQGVLRLLDRFFLEKPGTIAYESSIVCV
jgi:hypothetical protein